jgi:signal transduction histidine kinase
MFERRHHESEYPGTGIGLAIVKKAVERMGGRVGLESEPSRGSAFCIELPSATNAQAQAPLEPPP